MTVNKKTVGVVARAAWAVAVGVVALGAVVLALGWLAPKFGIGWLRLPAGDPMQLAAIAGVAWLSR